MKTGFWQLFARLIMIMVVSWSSLGCATMTLSKRPAKKDLSVLNIGTPRNRVIAELGQPMSTSEKGGERTDSFAFDPGVSGGYKFGRGFFHIGADIITIFLWEIVGWPGEVAASNRKKKMDVVYDMDDKVKTVTDWTKKNS